MMQKENCEKRKNIQKEHRGLCSEYYTVKPVLSGHSKRTPKIGFKTDYRLMQFKIIAECSKGTFIKLLFVI